MTGISEINASVATSTPHDNHAQLRRLADELESVFLNQLFQAMRASVPAGGLGEPSPGEEMFTAMLDEQLAKEAAFNWERGLGEQIYRQLSRRMMDQATDES
jgi:flagellar protein FlgJ